MDDLISRQDAIRIVDSIDTWQAGWRGNAIESLKAIPSAQPDLDEWCHDCKEYDQERHCCPRWNRVIRNALKDAQPNYAELAQTVERWYNKALTKPYIENPLAWAIEQSLEWVKE